MKKRYKIAYGNLLKWLAANTFRFIINLTIPILMSMFITYYISKININITENISIIIIAIGIFVTIPTLLMTFIPQYIELNNAGIKVRRFTCIGTHRSPFLGKYSFDIPYSEIIDIDWIVDTIDFLDTVPTGIYNGPSVFSCDFNNTLLIHSNSGLYIVSVKNSDDFYKRVLQSIDRIKFLKELKIDECIVRFGIEYDDIRLKWNGKELSSVYFIDNNNNKITVAEFEYDKNGERHLKSEMHQAG